MLYLFLFLAELLVLFVLSKVLINSLSTIIFALTRRHTAVVYILAFLFFPGSVIHELAHFLFAEVLLVRTGTIDLFPRIDGEHVKLGSVEIVKTDPIRRAIIGCAPFLFGTMLIGFVAYYVVFVDRLQTSLFVFLALYSIFEISNTMFSSRRDMEGTLELLCVLAVICLLLFFLGVRLPQITFSSKIITALQTIDLFFLVPFVLNMVIIGAAQFVLKLRK